MSAFYEAGFPHQSVSGTFVSPRYHNAPLYTQVPPRACHTNVAGTSPSRPLQPPPLSFFHQANNGPLYQYRGSNGSQPPREPFVAKEGSSLGSGSVLQNTPGVRRFYQQPSPETQTSDQRPHSSPSGSMASDSTFSHNDPRSHQYGGYPHDPFGSAAALLGVPHQQPSGLPPMSSHRPERNSSRSLPLVKARSRSDSPTALARPGVTASATLRATKSHDPITAEIKRIRNKESSQRFRDRTKERQREKDLRLDFLENRVFELESVLAEASVIRDENRALKMQVGELERQIQGGPCPSQFHT